MDKSRLYLWLGVAMIIVIALAIYYFPPKTKDIEVPERVTLTGVQVCLPHKDKTGPTTKECALGFKAEDGKHYVLDFSFVSQNLPEIPFGEKFTATGVFTQIELVSTTEWDKYDVVGIFSVTDSISILKEESKYINSDSDKIVVDLPSAGSVTGKEFIVLGKARGFWYFEGSFPVKILDKDGKVLASHYATAEDEWMTEEFVPFTAPMKVTSSYIGKATLILERNNASGLPEHDASLHIPITIEY